MNIRSITKADYNKIVSLLDTWWGGPAPNFALHVFFHELGENSLIAEENGELIGFLFGFVVPRTTQAPSTGYVHLVGISPDARRKGVGKRLYSHFGDRAKAFGATRLKAITSVGNETSLRFHEALGFDIREDRDYAGEGFARIVFTKLIK